METAHTLHGRRDRRCCAAVLDVLPARERGGDLQGRSLTGMTSTTVVTLDSGGWSCECGYESALSYSEASMKPARGAVLVLRRLTQARPRGADVLVGPLTGEDPLVQTAGGQDVFLIHPAERQTVGTATAMRGDKR